MLLEALSTNPHAVILTIFIVALVFITGLIKAFSLIKDGRFRKQLFILVGLLIVNVFCVYALFTRELPLRSLDLLALIGLNIMFGLFYLGLGRSK